MKKREAKATLQSAPADGTPTPRARRRATLTVSPILETPAADPIATIVELGVRRRFCLKSALRQANATGAIVRRLLGWRPDLTAAEAAAIKRRAAALITGIEKGAAGDDPLAAQAAPFVLLSAQAMEPIERERAAIEKEMRRLAHALPVWSWVESTPGLGDLGLALITAEAGDVSRYANPGKLWKRLGLAVMDGTRQGGLSKSAPAEAWIAHGYSPRRRSTMWTLGDSLLKAKGPYREVYLARKAYEIAKAEASGLTVAPAAKIPAKRKAEFRSQGHVHKRAQRYTEKRLLRDLWRAWRAATQIVTPTAPPPPADPLSPAPAAGLLELANRRRPEVATR